MASTTLKTAMLLLALMFCVDAAGFKLLGVKWPTPATTMYDNIPGSSPSGTSWNQAFSQAAGYWNAGSVFKFNIVNETSDPCAGLIGPDDGGRNGVGFTSTLCGRTFGFGTLAVTTTYSNPQTSQIVEADIAFNSNVVWDVYNGPWLNTAADFRRVAAHELGHVLGLDHEDSVPALMATFVQVGSTIEQPTADDLNGVAAIYGGASAGAILLTPEEPLNGDVKTGISNLRGWVIGISGINRVELYIDGAFVSNVPVGGRRTDVGAAFPSYPNSVNSGYSMAFNYSNLTPGNHSIRLRAVDNAGSSVDQSATFTVVRFDNPFISDPATVNLTSATITHDNASIFITHLNAGGSVYNVTLQWRTATQSYEIVQIQRVSP